MIIYSQKGDKFERYLMHKIENTARIRLYLQPYYKNTFKNDRIFNRINKIHLIFGRIFNRIKIRMKIRLY